MIHLEGYIIGFIKILVNKSLTILVLLLITILLTANSNAQTNNDSLIIFTDPASLNFYSQKFNKQLNIYNLSSNLKYQYNVDRFYFNVREDYSSTFIKSSEKSTRDENFISLNGVYNFSELISFGSLVQSNILSDSRKIEINSASANSAVIFTKITPLKDFSIAPFFGFESNRQIGEIDEGNIYGAEGIINKFRLTDTEIYSTLKFRNEDISPRKNSFRDVKFQLSNSFDNNLNNVLRFSFVQSGRDFYQYADTIIQQQYSIKNNIQNRLETAYQLFNVFDYNNFLPNISLTTVAMVNWRSIDRNTRYRNMFNQSAAMYDTKINELRFELESGMLYKTESINTLLRFNYNERDEKHQTKNISGSNPIFFDQRTKLESQKNNVTQRMMLTISSEIFITKKDLLSLSLLQNKLRYDTPSEDNFDDRDELLTILKLKYLRTINSFLELFADLEGSISRLSYIFAERSSNNNINRVIKLNTGSRFTTSDFESQNNFEVLANYTVYDFEDINPNYKSYTYRQFLFSDSTNIKLSKSSTLKLTGYFRLSEQGELSWAQFSMKPTRQLEEVFIHPKLLSRNGNFIFGIGFRHFSLKTFAYKNSDKNEEAYYSSVGPSAEISYNVFDKIILRMDGWMEFVNSGRKNYQEIASLNFNLDWNF
ncbi:MAG: hypothetical protein Q8N03_15805 [Ignavibacteria bacterium]|nr:hypothetical protein [Ignavibacteria bacterium]